MGTSFSVWILSHNKVLHDDDDALYYRSPTGVLSWILARLATSSSCLHCKGSMDQKYLKVLTSTSNRSWQRWLKKLKSVLVGSSTGLNRKSFAYIDIFLAALRQTRWMW
ncbi:hypothetical protein RchiOBHm_Chr4g0429921 [Rosa chinensis]|uniref:Uncharacterized protein n=1 Tax=Rosa chinensis TaxID=74649 RepID=A0A2P6R0G4_ROSCH|nr:hypothetical protein RchiOBHm_Chr4g0429921 [Rosa chinensis]